VRSKTDGLV